MPPDEVGEEAVPAVDVKSRIAAFSQSSAQAPPLAARARSPALRKTPSTSQLLPAWQQQQQQASAANDGSPSLLKPSHALLSRPRSLTGEHARPGSSGERSSPKMGVKSIIALYGQAPAGEQNGGTSAPSSPAQHMTSKETDNLHWSQTEESGKGTTSAWDTAAPYKRAPPPPPPPPSLPPRSRSNMLSQSNTGSSSSSSSNSGHHAGTASPSQNGGTSSVYAPYVRRNGWQAQSPATTSANSFGGVPALPPRSWAARSSDDLTLATPSDSSARPSTVSRRMVGAGPRWASSSSGNLTMSGEGSGQTNPATTSSASLAPPAVPPRASTSNITPTSMLAPPPKRATVTPSTPHTPPTPSRIHRSTSGPVAASMAAGMAGPVHMSNGSTHTLHHTPRSSLSSIPSIPTSTASTVIAPPPRHIDARRLGPATHTSTSSTSSIRSVQRQQRPHSVRRKQRKSKRPALVYSREAGEAEQRYGSLFDERLKQQEMTGPRRRTTLGKRAVVRIWRQSRLEDWFLARVWDQAMMGSEGQQAAGGGGIARAPFVRAMSAIDHELSRRKAEREAGGIGAPV